MRHTKQNPFCSSYTWWRKRGKFPVCFYTKCAPEVWYIIFLHTFNPYLEYLCKQKKQRLQSYLHVKFVNIQCKLIFKIDFITNWCVWFSSLKTGVCNLHAKFVNIQCKVIFKIDFIINWFACFSSSFQRNISYILMSMILVSELEKLGEKEIPINCKTRNRSRTTSGKAADC
jgi:hypothetical protein